MLPIHHTAPPPAGEFGERLQGVRDAIARARRESPLLPPEPKLIAVSKQQPEARVEAALAAGLRVFGENRVQEAQARWATRKQAMPEIELHLIGPLQSNKAREAVALFDCIHTVDRTKIADALAAEMARQGRRLPCFLQVNTGQEPQKAGVAPRDLPSLYAHARERAGLEVVGLMCIPPLSSLPPGIASCDSPEAGLRAGADSCPRVQHPAPHFALLRKLAGELGLERLSMGMSGDFAQAVRLGATDIRLGSALFGVRNEAP